MPAHPFVDVMAGVDEEEEEEEDEEDEEEMKNCAKSMMVSHYISSENQKN